MLRNAKKSSTPLGKTIAQWADIVVSAAGGLVGQDAIDFLRSLLVKAGFEVEEKKGAKSVTCTVTVKSKDGKVVTFASGRSQAGADEALLQACAAAMREGK